MTAAHMGQFKDAVRSSYTLRGPYIRTTNRFDSPAPVRLVYPEDEREGDLKLTDMEFGDLEALARIDLDEEERDRLRLQLDRIIGFVRKLQEVDTGTEEKARADMQPSALPAADDPGECLDREEVLGQAPDRENGFFRVPSVIERKDGGA